MPGRLTTHAQDIVLGHGAGGLKVWVWRITPAEPWLGQVELDGDGRGVLVEGAKLIPGLYELNFHIGDYHVISLYQLHLRSARAYADGRASAGRGT